MAIEITGIDHVYFTVSGLKASETFYDKFMAKLGFRKNCFLLNNDPHIQYYNRHFGFVLRPAKNKDRPHDNLFPGLHHFCFRVESCSDVDAAANILSDAGIASSRPQFYPEYAPDYYAVYFMDPDGIKLEITNYREERRRRNARWEQA